MNFIQHQQTAKSRFLLLLILLFVALILLLSLASIVVSAAVYVFVDNQAAEQNKSFQQWVFSPVNLWVTFSVLLFVLMSSLYKWRQLLKGGRAVAELLGGRLISPNSLVPEERKVLNIVEEMAIASGNPIPNVYVIDDTSINAFIAGHNRRDAVAGVTRGCIKILNREELKGLIAHEFNHLNNQNMRLNMRVIIALHGILFFGIVGYRLTRGSRLSRRFGTAIYGTILGTVFSVLGYCGTFLGGLIKVALNRETTLLADDFAVQFTRNPRGLGNVLKKIGGLSQSSYLSTGRAIEFSHLFFCQGINTSLENMLATQTPIVERIKRVDPNWNGSYETQDAKNKTYKPPKSAEAQGEASNSHNKAQQFQEQAMAFIGSPQAFHKSIAEQRMQSIPENTLQRLRNAPEACMIVYALMMSHCSTARETQLKTLKENVEEPLFDALQAQINSPESLPPSLHLLLIELCLPGIKQLPEEQFTYFRKNLTLLIKADKKISLPSWCYYRIIEQNYYAAEHKGKQSIEALREDISLFFSLVVYARKSPSPGGAFKAAVNTLEVKNLSFKLSDETFSLQNIEQAVTNLCELKLNQKLNVLSAVAAIIGHDGKVSTEDAELFRAIANIFDCPIPPISSTAESTS